MHDMIVIASTVAESVEDEEKKFVQVRELLGPEWTVLRGIPDASAA